jgi:hypothetical protein
MPQKTGRPGLAKSQRRSCVVRVLVTKSEWDLLDTVAHLNRKTLSLWAREVLVKEAQSTRGSS